MSFVRLLLPASLLILMSPSRAAAAQESPGGTPAQTLEGSLPVRIGDGWEESLRRLRSEGARCSQGSGKGFWHVATCEIRPLRLEGQAFSNLLLTSYGGKGVDVFVVTVDPFNGGSGRDSSKPSCERLRSALVAALGPQWRVAEKGKSGTKVDVPGDRSGTVNCIAGKILSVGFSDAWIRLRTGKAGSLLSKDDPGVAFLPVDRILSLGAASKVAGGLPVDEVVLRITMDVQAGFARARAKTSTLSDRSRSAFEKYSATVLAPGRIKAEYLASLNQDPGSR